MAFCSAGLSKRALNLDTLQSLRDFILRPMISDGTEGVNKSVEVSILNNYFYYTF